jgi:integrase
MDSADGYDREAYTASRENRQPIPPEVLRVLLQQADTWSRTDPSAPEPTTQRNRAKGLQARRKRREGVQLAAMLRLALNCGLDNVDCARIRWEHLRDLEGALPHMNFARAKREPTVGTSVERLTPLLPEVTDRIRRWRDSQPVQAKGFVFRTAHGGSYASHSIERAFGRFPLYPSPWLPSVQPCRFRGSTSSPSNASASHDPRSQRKRPDR